MLNFNPRACYIDQKICHNYMLYDHPENKLTPEDLQLPKFFDAARITEFKEYQLAFSLLENIVTMSPNQIALALAVIYRLVEYCIGKLLEFYEIAKLRKKKED